MCNNSSISPIFLLPLLRYSQINSTILLNIQSTSSLPMFLAWYYYWFHNGSSYLEFMQCNPFSTMASFSFCKRKLVFTVISTKLYKC